MDEAVQALTRAGGLGALLGVLQHFQASGEDELLTNAGGGAFEKQKVEAGDV
jgi:hypothetical protein